MDEIVQALISQYLAPTQIEVDEMGMGNDNFSGMAQALMNASTDVPMKQNWAVNTDFGTGKKKGGISLQGSGRGGGYL